MSAKIKAAGLSPKAAESEKHQRSDYTTTPGPLQAQIILDFKDNPHRPTVTIICDTEATQLFLQRQAKCLHLLYDGGVQ